MPVKKEIYLFFVLCFVAFFNPFISCKKDKFITNGGNISFSTDTLKFDTVFTTLGSVTRSFKIYNNNNKRIKFDEIRLEVGDTSYFRMNVDGNPTKSIRDVELAPNDSLYIFVALTINPSQNNLPFLLEDKVVVSYNGTQQNVPLQAFGQDAHYINDSTLNTQTWINDKPYVIMGQIGALVDSNQVLTIQKGCRIYVRANCKLYVDGTLRIFGTKTDSVIFQGDRLDRDYFGYKDYPGEWAGLHFLKNAHQCSINYTIIKNAGLLDAAVYVQPTPSIANPIIEFNKCIIENSAGYGVVCFNTNIKMNNCLIHTCGLQNIAIIEGGNYEFNHCTVATYGGLGINHAQQPSMAVLNYRDISLTQFAEADLNANFTNCIIYGSLDDETFFNKKGTADYNVKMENCMFKNTTNLGIVNIINRIPTQDPQFIDVNKWDYHVQNTSPCKAVGVYQGAVPDDLDDKTRTPPTTIGCYEAP